MPLLRHICFYNLFLPLKKASDDARRTLDQRKLFSPRSEWCYECSSSLSKLSSSQKEREKRSQHFHSKALESSVFFNQKRAVFCTKKKRKTIAKIKFSRVKHLRVSRRTTQQRKRRKERERERKFRLLFFPSFCAFLEDFFRARERDRETERERKNFIRVVASLTSEN